MPKPKPSAQPQPPPANEDSKPLVLVGMELTSKGYVVVSATIRGEKVVAKQEHSAPEGKEWAARVLRRVLQQKVLFPNGR